MLLSTGIGALLFYIFIPGRNMPSNRQVPGNIPPISSGEVHFESSTPLFPALRMHFNSSSIPSPLFSPPPSRLQSSPLQNPSNFWSGDYSLSFTPRQLSRTDICAPICDTYRFRINLPQMGDPTRFDLARPQPRPVVVKLSGKGGLVVVVVEIID